MMDFTRFTSLENVKFHPYAEIFPHMYKKVLFFYFNLKQLQKPKKSVLKIFDYKILSGKNQEVTKYSSIIYNIFNYLVFCFALKAWHFYQLRNRFVSYINDCFYLNKIVLICIFLKICTVKRKMKPLWDHQRADIWTFRSRLFYFHITK